MESSRSLQLAELGMEEALWALTSNTWTGWSTSSVAGVPTASKPIPNFITYENGTKGDLTLTVSNYSKTTADFTSSNTPRITLTSVATVTLANGTTVTRTLTSDAKPPVLFNNALGTSGALSFSSAAGSVVDSFNSHPAPTYGLTAYVATNPASLTTANSSAVLSGGTVDIGNAQVYGYVGSNGTALQNSSSAKVLGPTTPGGTNIDSSRVSTTTYQTALDPVSPTGGSNLYDPNTGSSMLTSTISGGLGSPSATVPSVYYLDYINLGNGAQLSINGPVILKVRYWVQTTGSGQIRVAPNGSLQIQIDENNGYGLYLQGGGISNETNDPQKLIVQVGRSYSGASQSLINTTQAFYGSLYLPNDTVSISSSFTLYGAMVAKSATFATGVTGAIHYDTSLQQIGFSGFSSTMFGLVLLREI